MQLVITSISYARFLEAVLDYHMTYAISIHLNV
jgi:hypothetical protein